MCLLGRMNKHMWKCHPMEYTRDLDIKLAKKLAQQHQQRLQQQKPKKELWHPQQTDVAEESWDNDNYPTYVPKKRTYGRQQQSQLQSEVEEESWNKDDYPTQQQQSEVQEESWDKDDYPTQQQQRSEIQEESWDKDDYPTQQQQQSQPQTEVEDDSWDMDDYPTYVSHNLYRNSF
jgi:hypothetical protein